MTVLDQMKAAVGPKGWTEDSAVIAPHLVEWRGLYKGQTPLMLSPATTDEVSAILRLASESGTRIAVQGGNTGLTCAGVPDQDGQEVLLSLGRMNRIRSVDARDFTLTAEAGVAVATLHQAAAELDRMFPLSLASEGSCMLGGVISTNAGGVNVLRYGSMRELVLGLEVVLPTGEIWNGLRALRKDNTGYDLKQYFIGAEGTLGVVTAAVVKLFPPLRTKCTGFVALPSAEAAIELFGRARDLTGDRLTAFELVPRFALEFVLKHIPTTRDPLTAPAPWYVLMEAAEPLEPLIAAALEDGHATDAVIAQSGEQATALWRLRESISEAQKLEGGSIKHDVSVPVSEMAAFIARASAAVLAVYPDARPVPFGHVGDGNVHFNIQSAAGADKPAFEAHWAAMNRLVHDIVVDMGGSISAEHGIGRLKSVELAHYRPALDLQLMRRIKAAFDPANILNRGRIFESNS
ncbi:FAD-binding oxidoreductase [Govanella unica]|uniref:FAD-binding oxidoreductase n=1 Tax=Govanella unica TaxID=2975056 RepID=A0A9X3TYC0_9PROT|nr:FAD-binding oxidoreductase [Govania unica]MDA5194023.1 FAD-binding oxidoreductase [Govania unica]